MKLHGIDLDAPGGFRRARQLYPEHFGANPDSEKETNMSSPAQILGEPFYPDEQAAKTISTNKLIEIAAEQGVMISSSAIRADASKFLKRSGIFSPSPHQMATAERAAVEHYLFAVKAAS